ncbi:peptidoglycan-binding protein [Streptomyces sp. NPDC008001]|uniref:peptidoglycan-binding domain-containing protein n=1 Tax=Streptomyces sp. NPDC008001 TaxID=3364804 RepID=UPI0036EA884D
MKSVRGLAASVALVATLFTGATALTAVTAGTAAAADTPVEGLSCGYDGRVTPPTVKAGSTGGAVKEAKCLLGFWGYVEVSHDPSGEFDAGTEAGVKAFQAHRGLPVTGVVGPETWEELRHSAGAHGVR